MADQRTALDQRLLDAHARDDRRALVGLYAEAAETANDLDAACFYLTHAWVFALDTDDPAAADLFTRLAVHHRV